MANTCTVVDCRFTLSYHQSPLDGRNVIVTLILVFILPHTETRAGLIFFCRSEWYEGQTQILNIIKILCELIYVNKCTKGVGAHNVDFFSWAVLWHPWMVFFFLCMRALCTRKKWLCCGLLQTLCYWVRIVKHFYMHKEMYQKWNILRAPILLIFFSIFKISFLS